MNTHSDKKSDLGKVLKGIVRGSSTSLVSTRWIVSSSSTQAQSVYTASDNFLPKEQRRVAHEQLSRYSVKIRGWQVQNATAKTSKTGLQHWPLFLIFVTFDNGERDDLHSHAGSHSHVGSHPGSHSFSGSHVGSHPGSQPDGSQPESNHDYHAGGYDNHAGGRNITDDTISNFHGYSPVGYSSPTHNTPQLLNPIPNSTTMIQQNNFSIDTTSTFISGASSVTNTPHGNPSLGKLSNPVSLGALSKPPLIRTTSNAASDAVTVSNIGVYVTSNAGAASPVLSGAVIGASPVSAVIATSPAVSGTLFAGPVASSGTLGRAAARSTTQGSLGTHSGGNASHSQYTGDDFLDDLGNLLADDLQSEKQSEYKDGKAMDKDQSTFGDLRDKDQTNFGVRPSTPTQASSHTSEGSQYGGKNSDGSNLQRSAILFDRSGPLSSGGGPPVAGVVNSRFDADFVLSPPSLPPQPDSKQTKQILKWRILRSDEQFLKLWHSLDMDGPKRRKNIKELDSIFLDEWVSALQNSLEECLHAGIFHQNWRKVVEFLEHGKGDPR